MASSSRVGFDCGEHDFDMPFAHHLRYRGQPLEADGWGDGFPADGYFPTAAERAAAAEVQRSDAMLTPGELEAERQKLLAALAEGYGITEIVNAIRDGRLG